MKNDLGAARGADPDAIGGSDAKQTFTTIAALIGDANAAGVDASSALALAMIKAASEAAEAAGHQRAAIALHQQQVDRLRASVGGAAR